jgi:hypothetical protein
MVPDSICSGDDHGAIGVSDPRSAGRARGTRHGPQNTQIYFLTSLPASISDNQPNAAPSTIDPIVGAVPA